nr:reverse transcriptase domain-containing protein [Tanacetum cinerariifolium]
MLERLTGNQYYCFLDGFSGYFQIPIDPKDQENPHSLVHMKRLLTAACLLGYAMHQARFRAKSDKSSINEPPEVEIKDLPPHLEYTFLEGDDKFPVIIAKDLRVEEKTALITVLKSHKRAIAWKLSDIKDHRPIVKETKYHLSELAQMATKGNLHARGLGFKPRRGGFPSGAKKEWGLSLRRRFESCILPN